MKLSVIVITLSLFVIAAFGPPTPWPDNLDELYQFIDEGAPGWVWERPCPVVPEITWAMVKEITAANADGDAARLVISTDELERIGIDLETQGTLDISEDELFGIAVLSVLGGAYRYGYNPTCKPDGDRVGIYGPAAHDIFRQLEGYVR